MWQYLWAHVVFHTVRLFPRKERIAIQVIITLVSMAWVLIPIVIITRPHSSDFCRTDLVSAAVALDVFDIAALGFCLVFAFSEAMTPWLCIAFHVFGLACALLAIVLASVVSGASSCQASTPELYTMLFVAMVAGLVSTGIVAFLALFWLIDWRKPGSVLDIKGRRGTCYELEQVFPCVWHI